MALFHLHLCNGRSRTTDPSGHDFVDLEAARQGSVKALREISSWDIQQGEVCIASFVEIEDDARRHLATVHFAEAVTILTETACAPR